MLWSLYVLCTRFCLPHTQQAHNVWGRSNENLSKKKPLRFAFFTITDLYINMHSLQKCGCICLHKLYVQPVLRPKDYVRCWIKIGSVVCLYTPVSPDLPEMEDVYDAEGQFLCVLYVLFFMCLYLLACQVRVIVGDSGLCCCVSCLSTLISFVSWFSI